MNFGNQTVSLKALMHKSWLDTEMRVDINSDKVSQYAAEKKEGADFPSPIVFFDTKEERYWTGDGFHRILADKENCEKETIVYLSKGTKIDAILKCIEINKKQLGLPFSRGDKGKDIKTLLTNEPTNSWSQMKIADTIGCTNAYVSFIISTNAIDRPSHVENSKGVLTPSTRVRQSSEDCERRREIVKRMVMEKKTGEEIAEETGASVYTIRNDIVAIKAANKIATCPHCNGSGFIEVV